MSSDLETIFHPRSVAVVGISPPERVERGFGMAAIGFLLGLLEMGFPTIYPVNPKYEEVAGLRCYPSLLDIEGPVDHVISSVPAHVVPQLVEECIAKGVRSIHFFTAGFRETGEEDRAALEEAVVRRAKGAGIRIFGPNCMGLYVPKAKLSFSPHFPKEPGPVAFISQSGGHAMDMVISGAVRGLRFSKVVSYGNASDVDESELLEYLATDVDSEIVCAYIEGVKDGRRFFSALKKVGAAKPTIVLKGGRTGAGSRATLSHTASLAGSLAVFDAALKQAGAIRVNTVEELVDVAIAFRFMGVPAGPRVAVVGPGGGMSVMAADELAEAGLDLPELPPHTQEDLRRFTPVAGTSVRNPVDTVTIWDTKALEDTLRIVGSAENVDLVLLHLGFAFTPAPQGQQPSEPPVPPDAWAEAIARARQECGKPTAIVIRWRYAPNILQMALALTEECWRRGIAVYFSLTSAVQAVAKVLAWRRMWEER